MPVYDSRAFAKRLEDAGMPATQADTLADETVRLLAEHLATKDDLERLRLEIQLMEYRLTLKLGGIMAALLGVMTAFLKLS